MVLQYISEPRSLDSTNFDDQDSDLARTDGRRINRRPWWQSNRGSYNEASELIPAPPRHSDKLISTCTHFPERSN